MQSVLITTNVVSSIPAHDDVHSIQDDMIKFINCTSVVSSAKKKITPHDIIKLLLKVALNIITLTLTQHKNTKTYSTNQERTAFANSLCVQCKKIRVITKLPNSEQY